MTNVGIARFAIQMLSAARVMLDAATAEGVDESVLTTEELAEIRAQRAAAAERTRALTEPPAPSSPRVERPPADPGAVAGE